MTLPRNPNAGRTCDRCRRPLPPDRRQLGAIVQCPRCLAERRDAMRLARAGERIAYTPLDEIIQQPLVRILRALRWFGCVEIGDLYLALNAEEYDHGAERLALAQALSRAVRAGFIEHRKARAFWSGRDRHSLNSYRITPAGRAELARRMTIDMEIADDEPATDERSQAA